MTSNGSSAQHDVAMLLASMSTCPQFIQAAISSSVSLESSLLAFYTKLSPHPICCSKGACMPSVRQQMHSSRQKLAAVS